MAYGTGLQSLTEAMQQGEHGMALSFAAAERAQPDFASIARESILAHLRAVGQASGEELTRVAMAHGAHAKDGRAFGGVFRSLAKSGAIKCLRSDLPRARGHGTTGGKLWSLA